MPPRGAPPSTRSARGAGRPAAPRAQARTTRARRWGAGGQWVEMEDGFAEAARQGLRERGHDVAVVPHVAGGMCAIAFAADGLMTGAACWRADGAPIGIGGGLARKNVRFWPDQ